MQVQSGHLKWPGFRRSIHIHHSLIAPNPSSLSAPIALLTAHTHTQQGKALTQSLNPRKVNHFGLVWDLNDKKHKALRAEIACNNIRIAPRLFLAKPMYPYA